MLAAADRLPTMFAFHEYVEAGGLMSYGFSLGANWRRAAYYVDCILHGTKPGDLPMELPSKPIAAGSPWQNPYAERLIGTIRRECLDHMIVFGEAHLRRILGNYAAYYNKSRIRRTLNHSHSSAESLNLHSSGSAAPLSTAQSWPRENDHEADPERGYGG